MKWTYRRPLVPCVLLSCVVVLAGCSGGAGDGLDTTGSWVGGFVLDGEFVPLELELTEGNGEVVGTASGVREFAHLPLEEVSHSGGELSFSLTLPPGFGTVVVSVERSGNELQGTAEWDGEAADVALIRTRRLESGEADPYEGAYESSAGRLLLVDERSGYLNLVDPESGFVRRLYRGVDGSFTTGPAYRVPVPRTGEVRFTLDPGGAIEALDWTPMEQDAVHAKRLPLRTEGFRVDNGDVSLAGTLVLPSEGGRHPLMVFTHGSGHQKRVAQYGLGYYLAHYGVAFAMFDKRGVEASTGNWREASFEDLADDAVAVAQAMAARPDIATDAIGFFGLSQGGWIAPLAAARFAGCAFVVAASGGGLTPERQEILDTEHELRAQGFAEEKVQEALAFQRERDRYSRTGEGWESYRSDLERYRDEPWMRLSDAGGPAEPDAPGWAYDRLVYFYDPIPTLRAVRCPVLALFGSLDTPLAAAENARQMDQSLREGGNRDVTVQVLPNGNHPLMEARTGSPTEYLAVTRFVPGLYPLVRDWVLKRVGLEMRS